MAGVQSLRLFELPLEQFLTFTCKLVSIQRAGMRSTPCRKEQSCKLKSWIPSILRWIATVPSFTARWGHLSFLARTSLSIPRGKCDACSVYLEAEGVRTVSAMMSCSPELPTAERPEA